MYIVISCTHWLSYVMSCLFLNVSATWVNFLSPTKLTLLLCAFTPTCFIEKRHFMLVCVCMVLITVQLCVCRRINLLQSSRKYFLIVSSQIPTKMNYLWWKLTVCTYKCMYVCMYRIYLNRSPGIYFLWMIFNPAFIRALSAFYIGIYLLYSPEPLRLFEPRHLYEPCFYSDKYGMHVYNIYTCTYKYISCICRYVST